MRDAEHPVSPPATPPTTGGVDALVPAAIARKAEDVGVAKATMPVERLVVLGVLAGAFISLGAAFSTTVTAGGGSAPGVTRLLGGVVFSLGLILVVVGGAELFTGNTLLVMATASRRISVLQLLRNWGIVFVANAVGAIGTALLVVWSGRLDAGDGSVGVRAAEIATAKTTLEPVEAFFSGVLANVLVCLAVWLSLSARTVADKVLAIVPPVAAFVAIGFEHSIANLYFVPVAILHRALASDADVATGGYVDPDVVTWDAFVRDDLLPVTLGNVVGGAVLVGLVYWFVYLRGSSRA